jgi:FSR family fosmidomycin resistance protein-like MFS transporter
MAQSGMKSALSFYLPVYLVQQGESLWYAGISLSILQFFGILGAFLSGNVSDRIGRKKTLIITTIGSIIFMALF